MGRLIREQDVLKVVRNGWGNHESCKEMCDEITCLPTAFDVEAVVEEFEEAVFPMINRSKAIEIVRKGGVK